MSQVHESESPGWKAVPGLKSAQARPALNQLFSAKYSYQLQVMLLNSFLHYDITFCTSVQFCAVCMCHVKRLLLLFKEEMCLVWGQAAEVCLDWHVETQLFGTAQTRLSKSQQLTVGTLLAVWKAAHMGSKSKLQTIFWTILNIQVTCFEISEGAIGMSHRSPGLLFLCCPE